MFTVGHGDKRLDSLAALGNDLDQWKEGQVEEQILVFRMLDDIGDLILMQARIDGVHHRSHAAYTVVELHVPIAVPCQRANAVGHFYAEVGERTSHLTRTAVTIAKGVANDVALYPA